MVVTTDPKERKEKSKPLQSPLSWLVASESVASCNPTKLCLGSHGFPATRHLAQCLGTTRDGICGLGTSQGWGLSQSSMLS